MAGELALVAVAGPRRLDALPSQVFVTVRVDRNALDRTRGGDGDDARLVREHPEQLGELVPTAWSAKLV